jgi:predicted aminopeptidase
MNSALKHTIRRKLFMLLAALFMVSLNGCYLIKQGCYVLKYSAGARNMEKMKQSGKTPEDVRAFFSLVGEIRQFASDSVGLSRNSNFTTFVNIPGNHVVNVVYGAGKLDFVPYTYRFPFFGGFPNKGFFDSSDARKEAEGLAAKGYDVCVIPAGAFSTLGFFSDPIYSYMKKYSPFRIASLIFHEQTHATLFIKNHVQFNEELAMFIGNEAALRFIKSKFGDTSENYRNAVFSMRDEDAYYGLMRSLHARLQMVYADTTVNDTAKLRLKQEIIGRFRDSVAANYDSLFRSQSYRGLSKAPINNATLVADMTYTMSLSVFRDLYDRKKGDFKAMLLSLKTLKNKKGDLHELVGKLE